MNIPATLAGSRRARFVRLGAIALARAVLAAGTALLVRHAFDAVVDGGSAWDAGKTLPLAALVMAGLAMAMLARCERVEAERFGQDYVHAIRLRLYDRLGTLTPRDLQGQSRGGHLLRFVGDLGGIRQWVSLGVARFATAAITFLSCLLVLAVINPLLAGTVAVFLGGGMIAALSLGRRLQQSALEARRRRARLASDVNERIALMPVIQSFAQVRRERGRIRRRSKALRSAMVRRARAVGLLRGLTEATGGISLAAVMLAGAHEIGQGRASLGAIVASLSVVAMLVPALRDLSRAYELWNAYVVARERIRLFLGRRPSVKVRASGPALPEGPGEVRFDDVVLGDLFNGLTATARSGSRVAIVGANGSGKSTLLSLVARLMEPDSGRILIDGHDLRTVNAASLREAIGVASADLPLMRGTVGRNIRYRRPRASDAEVRRVCELCGIDEMLADIPGGMAARVAEGGLNLSPGQRQRIAIARALLGNPRILLLDEIDANLDGEASRLFERVLEASKGTILFVSHRKEQIMKADVVWRLVEGSIIEQGSPAALSGRVGSSGLPLERRATRAA